MLVVDGGELTLNLVRGQGVNVIIHLFGDPSNIQVTANINDMF